MKATINIAADGSITGQVEGTSPSQPGDQPAGSPMQTTPADGRTYSFHGFPANRWVSTYAGGDGRFSAAVPSGNASWKVKVNGTLTIDGSMDMSPVKAGDAIEWMITTPDYQDDCMYTISP